MFGENLVPVVTCSTSPSECEQHGVVSQHLGQRDCWGLRKSWMEEIKKLIRCTKELSWLRRRFTLQEDNDDKCTQPRQHVLEWPSRRPDPRPIKHVQRDLKKGHLLTAPINLSGLESLCREEQQNVAKSRRANFVKSGSCICCLKISQKVPKEKLWNCNLASQVWMWVQRLVCFYMLDLRGAGTLCAPHNSAPPQFHLGIKWKKWTDEWMDTPIYSLLSTSSLLNA